LPTITFNSKYIKLLGFLLWTVMLVYALLCFKNNGDFVGYVDSGNLLLDGKNIYNSMFNTWPPAFSILSVPFAIINNINFHLVRFLWMIVLFQCLLFSIKTMTEFLEQKPVTYRSLFSYYIKKPWFVLSLLFVCRAMMDNIMYMQINLPMLAVALLALRENKTIKNNVWIGISIGSKVFNIFLIPLYVLLRKWKSLLGIFIGLLVVFVAVVLVFGIEQTLQLHRYWYDHIASVKHGIHHRNQSLMAGFFRLFSEENILVNNQKPLIALKDSYIKAAYYTFTLLLALLYFSMFFRQILKPTARFYQFSVLVIITAIPLLTPLVWKANYIYALPAVFYLIYHYHLHKPNTFKLFCFSFAMFCLTFSAEVIVSRAGMYWLEKQNVLPIGQLLLYFLLLMEYEPKRRAEID